CAVDELRDVVAPLNAVEHEAVVVLDGGGQVDLGPLYDVARQSAEAELLGLVVTAVPSPWARYVEHEEDVLLACRHESLLFAGPRAAWQANEGRGKQDERRYECQRQLSCVSGRPRRLTER